MEAIVANPRRVQLTTRNEREKAGTDAPNSSRGAELQGTSVNSKPAVSPMLFGAAKPGARL